MNKIAIISAIFVFTLLVGTSYAAGLLNEKGISDFYDAAMLLLPRFNHNASFSYVNATYYCNATICVS